MIPQTWKRNENNTHTGEARVRHVALVAEATDVVAVVDDPRQRGVETVEPPGGLLLVSKKSPWSTDVSIYDTGIRKLRAKTSFFP